MVQFKHLRHNMRTDNASAWIKKGKQRVTEAALPPTTAVLIKGCSENMQQMYRRTPMPKCDFNKVGEQAITLRHGCSPVNLPHIFRTHSPKNTSGRLLLESKLTYSKPSWVMFQKASYILKLMIMHK